MSDQQLTFEEAPKASKEPRVFSVSELNEVIKDQLEGHFGLVWIRGEISNFKPHTSGHFYFSLKDGDGQISAVMFKGYNRALRFKPQDGMEVLIRGKVSVYVPRGTYQIYCEVMEPVGVGALQMAFDQLKKKLSAEGLFDPSKKRPLPSFPTKIAIVTSPTGAAIKDMLNVLSRRFRGIEIFLVPCSVQGDAAPKEIVAAIELANRVGGFDVMIVGRGGGSIEDLWAFNDERVARAIAASKIPTVSAVGHEIDVTIADFVADLRAPTPSAAAELVVKNAADISDRLATNFRRLRIAMLNRIAGDRRHADLVSRRLVDPKRKLQDLILRCDELTERLETAVLGLLEKKKLKLSLTTERLADPKKRVVELRSRVDLLSLRLRNTVEKRMDKRRTDLVRLGSMLDSLSPMKVVDRGYSMVSKKGSIVRDASQVTEGDSVEIRLAKGSIEAKVTKIKL